MLTPEEFTRRAVDLPWKRRRGDWQAMDCWGLMALYCIDVLGVDLGSEPAGPFAPGDAQAMGWQQCAPDAGQIALMGWRYGAPTHCAVLIDGGRKLLHSAANTQGVGRVQIARLSWLLRLYPDLTAYRRASAC